MKKSLVALAVLGSFAGIASAATSVTLYGNVEAAYTDWSGSNGHKALAAGSVTQAGGGSIGVKGQEDLGNGLAATFKLEGDVKADTGSTTSGQLFNKESTVGLKGAFGEVKVGRAKSQMELALGGVVPGHQLADVDLYSVVAARHSNGLFYSYDNAGFSFGADVTTKGGSGATAAYGGYTGSLTEGSNVITVTAMPVPTSIASAGAGWGVRAGYAGQVGGGVTLLARAAYQRDGYKFQGKQQYEAGGLVAAVVPYSNNALTIGAAYAQGRGFSDVAYGVLDRVPAEKARTISAVVASTFGPNDSAYIKYQQRKATEFAATGGDVTKVRVWAAGYQHNLSKRTSVYADVVNAKTKGVSGSLWGYGVGINHNF